MAKTGFKNTLKSLYKKFVRPMAWKVAFMQDYYAFLSKQNKTLHRFNLSWNDRIPIMNEKTSATYFDAHYIYHPAWAARILARQNPSLHIDISSSLNFCTMLSAFIPVDFYDYRPAKLHLSGLRSERGDLMHLPFEDNSVESLSCMHVVEHIGLGRYGDPIDPDGDLKAISELKRILMPGGSFLFVVPVGQPKIQFNANRIYSYEQISSYFSDLQLEQFALVNDRKEFILNADSNLVAQQKHGCGCWHFIKQ